VKTVIAIIQPTKLNAVREALEKIEVTRMTVCDGQGFGRRQGQMDLCGGRRPDTMLLRKVVLEVVVNDDFLDRTVATIVGTARTGPAGDAGDGNVFVLPTEQAIQVDDAARGPGAV
jgi:nitrogen regulatory protein PII